MEILKPYNDSTLQLISDDTSYEFTPSLLEGGSIKLSVFSDIGSFRDSEDLQQDIDFYVKDDKFFLKPNEYLDRNGFGEGNYNLQYDFLRRLDTSNFHISQVSPSGKEIRLEITTISIDDDLKDLIGNFMKENPIGEIKSTYQFNSYLELSQGRLIPINGYAFDNITNDKRTLILKLNESLPSDIEVLSTNFNISNKFLSSQTETIFFIDREQLAVSGLGLEIDQSYLTQPHFISSSYENYAEITSSVSLNIVEELVRLKKDVNLNIDYSKFDNHVFFGSAKSKLQNFKTKVVKLEGLQNELSSSLPFSASSNVIEKRKDLFKKIREIENDFTHYEHFMYHDGQSYSTSSAPGVGQNLAGRDLFGASQPGFTHTKEETIQDYDGFDLIYKKQNNGYIHLTTDLYNVEQPPFYNSNDFFYLSFLLRGDGATSEYNLNISGGLANEKYSKQLDNYNYYKDRQIPFDAWSGSALLNPEVTGSHYRRFIFKAQQNYFRPTGNAGYRITNSEVANSFAEASTAFEILSGSNVISASISGSTGDGFAYGILDTVGTYVPYFFPSQFGTDGILGQETKVTASLLPQGDLFPVFTQEGGDKQALFTDVIVSKNNPSDIHPFSKIYRPPSGSYAGSSEWNDWYDIQESIASDYDDNNIHSLVNNLPLSLRTADEHQLLRDFVNMLGEQFDLLRSYIDNYHNIYRLGYKNPNSMPDNLLPIIGDTLGYDLKNSLVGDLESYLESTQGDEIGDKKAIASLWTKILNNIIYIYKTKGTQESLNTLLNLYGYDTNSFKLTEYGGSDDEHNPSVVTNNAANDLDNGLKNVKGNVSFLEKAEPFRSLNLTSGSDYLALDWYSNDAEPNGIEFIFRTENTTNNQTLFRSSGSVAGKDHWDLRIIPSGSSNQRGKLEFRLNNSEQAQSGIVTNAISMSTDFVDDINNFKYYNVMLQRNIVTSSYEATSELTQSYHMFIGRKHQDKIQDIQHISMSSTSSFANQNFITASGQSSNNLLVGEIMTGSIAQIRAWDSYISMSKFKQHILNYQSIVGGTVTAARDNLVYHYPLNENENSTTIKDISSTNKVKSFDKTVSSQPSLEIKNSISTIKNFSFQVRGTDAIKSDKQYKIGTKLKVVGGLNDKVANLKQPVKDGTNEPKVKVVNKVGKTYSYVDAIDAIIINAMSDFVLDDYLDDINNSGSYGDLLTLRKQLITERDVAVDIVQSLSTIEKHTDNPEFTEKIESILPAKSKLEFAYEVKNDILFRSKLKRASLQTEVNPNSPIGSASLAEPDLSILFNENKYEKFIDVPLDELSVSGFANENLKEQTINILKDVGVTSTANENVKTNHSEPIDIVDLSDSVNQSVYTVQPDITSILLGSKNEFYKNHGKGDNQVYFKSSNVGANGDYNTYKYETRFFFRTIGDIEEFFPVSGTFESRTDDNAKQPFNHHDNFRHFGNRYYVDSGSGYTYSSFFGSDDATVDGRMVGRTLFFKSDSDGNITYPINHYFKVGTSKDSLTNLIYKGTQNDGSNPPYFDPELDTSPKISAYTISVGGSDTTKKLKVIR